MTVLAVVPSPSSEPLSRDDARELTGRIRILLGDALDLIADAWAGRAWEALGHPTWEAYLAAEVPEVKLLGLPVDVRRDAVARWSGRGMSQAAMAKGLNVSAGTINNDVRQVVPAEEGAVVVSLDGRRRPARTARPAPPKPQKLTRTDEALALIVAAGAAGLTSTELAKRARWERDLASATLSRLNRRKLVQAVGVFRGGRGAYAAASPA